VETHKYSEDVCCGEDQTVACAAVLRRKELRTDRAEHAVHDLRVVDISSAAAIFLGYVRCC